MNDLERELFEMLKEAQEHLNYCGYGDSWERECAAESKLQERLDTLIERVEKLQ